MNHPLIRDVEVYEDWLDGDVAYVSIVNDASARDARMVWCEVLLPSGLDGRTNTVLETADARFEWPMPRD